MNLEKKKMGRPSKPNKRDERMTVIFSETEREEIEGLCRECDVSFSAFVRRITLAHLAQIKAAKGGEQ